MKTLFAKAAIAAALAASTFAFTSPAAARHGDDDAAIAIGAGIIGLAIGAAIASDDDDDRYYDRRYYDSYPRYRTYYRYDSYPRYYRYDYRDRRHYDRRRDWRRDDWRRDDRRWRDRDGYRRYRH